VANRIHSLPTDFSRILQDHQAEGRWTGISGYRESGDRLIAYLLSTYGTAMDSGLTFENINAWVVSMQLEVLAGRLDVTSMRSHLRRIRGMASILDEMNGTEIGHLIRSVRLPTEESTQTLRVPSRSEIAALIQGCDRTTDRGRLDAALIAAVGDSGVSLEDLVWANAADADAGGGWIVIGGPDRGRSWAFLGQFARTLLADHLECRSSGPVFADDAGDRLGSFSLGTRIEFAAARAKVDPINAELLRRYAAVKLLATGLSDEILATYTAWTFKTSQVSATAMRERFATQFREISPIDQLMW
jgi:site-specific recombinase XerC